MDIKKELQDLCDRYKAEAEAILAKAEKKAWKPEVGKTYYWITGEGLIADWSWQEDERYSKNNYAIGNCFPTKEAAEFAVEKLKVIAELKRFAEEHNEEIDWGNSERKWSLAFDVPLNHIRPLWAKEIKNNSVYFSSEEIAKAAIEAIGEERLKKYYFEVEE